MLLPIRTFHCLIKGDNCVFKVEIAANKEISDLKEKIREEGIGDSHPILAKDLTLLKVDIDLNVHTRDSLSQLAINSDGIRMLDWMQVSEVWREQPAFRKLHIIVKLPPTTVTPSSSRDSPPNWLAEIHKKLWGKSHLFGEIFRTANLTTADFIQLQLELERINPSRTEPSYKAQDVLKVKADFLRKKSRNATLESDNAPNCKLVPSVSLVAPSSTLSTLPCAMDLDATADTMDVDADAEADPAPQPANCPGYIIADAKELSTGSTAVLPCTIRYMDLTTLELKESIPVKRLTLIRDEWNIMINLFNGRKRGVHGSAIFTGSPGIGKTCFLYYILILCLIKGQPVVFQDMCGDVYLITDEVRSQTKGVTVAGDDVLTLIDADGQTCQPYKYIFRNRNLRILLTSSPTSRKDRKWLRHNVEDEWAAYVMTPWSQNEWLVALLFIVEKDITLNRFWKTFEICGSVPRQFLQAAESREARKRVQVEISDAIQKSKDIEDAINGVVGDEVVPHPAFVVYPSNEARLLIGCHVKAISKGAMNTIIKILDRRNADAAFDLYQSTRGSSLAVPFRGNMWERKAHGYLGACLFTIRSLDDMPDARLGLPEDIKYFAFGPPQELSGKIADCVNAKESVYLQPISDNFASLNSIIYQPNNPLIGIQITNASTHPIETKGLKALQSLLSPKNESLSPLRPTSEKPWIILFVVPKRMEKSFTRQSITGHDSAAWSKKTVQYVLGLDERQVFRPKFGDVAEESENE
ncbi:hypothetical protein F5887DRAFT_1224859 [Amanita rubescens]|nr:hypothetical protein F5887DRAFT_1224859 [Amanita rubescens]